MKGRAITAIIIAAFKEHLILEERSKTTVENNKQKKERRHTMFLMAAHCLKPTCNFLGRAFTKLSEE